MIEYALKLHLQEKLNTFSSTDLDSVRKSLYITLLKAEELGWTWGVRNMYGGGKEISLYEEDAPVAFMYEGNSGLLQVEYYDDYFKTDFKLPDKIPYNHELDAELKNEEALYGYQLTRPWH